MKLITAPGGSRHQKETTPMNNDDRIEELERRLKKAEEQIAQLISVQCKAAREFIEPYLGRPPTDEECNQLAQGVSIHQLAQDARSAAN
jgi:transposase